MGRNGVACRVTEYPRKLLKTRGKGMASGANLGDRAACTPMSVGRTTVAP